MTLQNIHRQLTFTRAEEPQLQNVHSRSPGHIPLLSERRYMLYCSARLPFQHGHKNGVLSFLQPIVRSELQVCLVRFGCCEDRD